MTARIVAYTFVDAGAADHGATQPRFNSTATLGVTEQATAGTTTYVRPTTPKPFYNPTGGDQLAAWDAALDAYTPAGLYAVTYSPTTARMTIASTNNVAFRPAMVEAGAAWSGFTQALGGWATTWTGASAPAAVVELLGATVEPADDNAKVDLHRYRHGRAVAVAWGNHQLHRVQLHFTATQLAIFDSGYVLAGRVRIHQGPDTAAYSPTNVDGVVDGYVVAATDPTEDGDIGELWTVNLIVAVPRG